MDLNINTRSPLQKLDVGEPGRRRREKKTDGIKSSIEELRTKPKEKKKKR